MINPDLTVVRGNNDIFHPAHLYASKLDFRILLQALDRFIEITDVSSASLEVLGGPYPDQY